MVNLSVNVNKIATLRNSRGGSRPDPLLFSKRAIEAGVQGITVHPRPDERHITYEDVFKIRKLITNVEYNIEGYPDERYLKIIQKAKPDQATLVPDPPHVLTSNAGWKVSKRKKELCKVVEKIQKMGVRVSIFMDTNLKEIKLAKETGTDRIELYTGPFAHDFAKGKGEASFQKYDKAAKLALDLGLGINAGHDLDLNNLPLFKKISGLQEVSIGHALICDSLDFGFEETIRKYLQILTS